MNYLVCSQAEQKHFLLIRNCMSINLLHTIQEKLGYPPLHKVDANTQQVKVEADKPYEDRFSQAAIPSVLTALYKYSRADEAAGNILSGNLTADWTTAIFSDNRNEAVEKIGTYSGYGDGEVIAKLNAIAKEAISIIREKVTATGTILEVKSILADSRNDVLPYLPADLDMGLVLHDNTLDDRTHKMEGPISSLMHAIGGSFSGSDSDETNQTNIPKQS